MSGPIETPIRGANIIAFPGRHPESSAAANSTKTAGGAFDRLTAAVIVDQHRRGVLPESILAALLASVGLEEGDAV